MRVERLRAVRDVADQPAPCGNELGQRADGEPDRARLSPALSPGVGNLRALASPELSSRSALSQRSPPVSTFSCNPWIPRPEQKARDLLAQADAYRDLSTNLAHGDA